MQIKLKAQFVVILTFNGADMTKQINVSKSTFKFTQYFITKGFVVFFRSETDLVM